MVHKSKVLHGVAAYIDNEIIAQLAGSWKAWVFGGLVGLYLTRADNAITYLSNQPMIKALGLIDGENIDVNAIIAELRKQAAKGKMTIDIPVIGPVTFGPEDIDKLQRYIMQAGG
jgi:hypothetical protein